MANGLRLVTLVYRFDSVDAALLQHGFIAVREHLTVNKRAPVVFVERSATGRAWLHVLCGGRISWRDVRDAWCAVAPGAVSVSPLRGTPLEQAVARFEPFAH